MSCDQCPFRGQPQVMSEGDPETCKYVLVGEAPAHDEIRLGRPFVGATGRLLMAFLKRANIKREECYICNALLCQLPRTKKGISEAVRCCRPRLLEELERINTGARLVVMGAIAREALYPNEEGGILASRGWRTWEGREAYVMAHPAYTLYNPDEAPMLLKDVARFERGRREPIAVEYEVLDTPELLNEFIGMLHRRPRGELDLISFDLETDQVDFQRDRVLCMSISVEYGKAYIIPDSLLYDDGIEFITTNKSQQWWHAFLTDERYRSGSYLHPNPDTAAMLRELFAIPGYTWTGHNAKFDLRFLKGQLGVVNAHCDFDTIIAHYTLDERKGGHALKPLADDYLDTGDYEEGLFKYISKKSARYSRIPRDVLYKYNAMDTEVTLRLAHIFERELKDQGLYEQPFMFPMMAAVPMLLDAELAGFEIDWGELRRMDKEEIGPALDEIAEELRRISGHPELNPLSSQSVNKIIYDELKLPIIEVRTRAAGKRIKGRSSQRAVMDGWAKLWEQGRLKVSEHAWSFIEKLREYRHIRKMRGSYVRKWQLFKGTDDRVHTSFLLRGTVTGRLSSKDPPMQTIPSKEKDKWGVLVSNAHISKPGWKLVYADYSQAELMVAACLSGDEFMLKSFRKEGTDYHTEVALAAFGEDFTDAERTTCKRLTFGWLYGGNVKEIAMQALQFEGPVAERFAHEWDERFKGILAWREAQQALMRKQGYVESIFGRRRRYTLLTDTNVGKAQRVAVNMPVQSATSDLTLISAMKIHEKYQGCGFARVVLLIHDSLVMEVRDDKVEEVGKAMHEVMLDTAAEYFPQIPFKADIKVSERLGELT